MSVKKLLGAATWRGLLLAILVLLALLCAAALMLQRGLLPESAAPAAVCPAYAAAVFLGGRSAVKAGECGPLPQAMAVAVCLYAAVWLVALGGTVQFAPYGPMLTAVIFGGAAAAGLLGRKGRRQAKRRSGERARPSRGGKRR